MALTLFYSGADMSWEQMQRQGFRRRNTCLLHAFSEHPEVKRIFVINAVNRSRALRGVFSSWRIWLGRPGKVVDLRVALTVFPERWKLPGMRALNRLFASVQVRLQTGFLPNRSLAVWCYWPAGYMLAARLRLPGKLIFDADHNILADDNASAGAVTELERLLSRWSEKVDLAVAGSPSMVKWFQEKGSTTLRLRNAVNPARFFDGEGAPQIRQRGKTPRIGYVGMISKWIDFELLTRLVKLRPEWKFVIAGQLYNVKFPKELQQAANVEILDYLPPSEVPRFVSSLDVTLGLYRKRAGTDVDSMKIYEYLAAGVPVVTTAFHDHLKLDFEGLLEIADDAQGIAAAIERVLQRDAAQQQDWRAEARSFVEKNTWSARADELVHAVTRPGAGDSLNLPSRSRGAFPNSGVTIAGA